MYIPLLQCQIEKQYFTNESGVFIQFYHTSHICTRASSRHQSFGESARTFHHMQIANEDLFIIIIIIVFTFYIHMYIQIIINREYTHT